VLALPKLDRIIQEGNAGEELTLRLERHVESFDLSASEDEAVKSYVG
jgi:hypothetical protein